MDFNELLEIAPFSLNKSDKTNLLLCRCSELTNLHYNNCEPYRRIIDAFHYNRYNFTHLEDLPMIPVRMFKDMDLKSIADEDIFKSMTSSGTTGQQVSKIYLDKQTASHQQKALVKIVKDFTGSGRMPMLIIDSPSVVKNRLMFSARGAGILGFSIFASDKAYALDDDMQIDFEGITAFLKKHEGKQILLFGFTFMIWQHFYKELLNHEQTLDLSNAILIHGGGWKKLKNEAVEPTQFKQALSDVCGLTHIHDYYGMVEQTGCIYMECECGHLHASIFSDILMRRTEDFSLCDIGEEGIIQVLSTIPESYPGHSILTEDKGVILGEDDCQCGRLGKYFKITGRIKNAEITFADRYSFAIFNEDYIDGLTGDALMKLAKQFYNDTYLMDQNACSTPHLIFWTREWNGHSNGKTKFWNAVYMTAQNYVLEDKKAVDKYTLLCEQVANGLTSKQIRQYSNRLAVVTLQTLPEALEDLRGKFGLFYEYEINTLDEIYDKISEKMQTCVTCGIDAEDLVQSFMINHVKGIDRIVPVGTAIDIGLNWDGYDLIASLSRQIMTV